MSERQLVAYVTVADEHGELHEFGPGDNVPGWAREAITNPSAWGEEPVSPRQAARVADDAASDEDTDGPEGDGEDRSYSAWTKPELESEVARRNEGRDEDDLIEVEGKGNKPDLVAALEADDAASVDGDE